MADLCIAAMTGNVAGTDLDAYVAQPGDVGPVFVQNGTDPYVGNAGGTGFYVSGSAGTSTVYTDNTVLPSSGVTLLTLGVTVHKFTNISFNQCGVAWGYTSLTDMVRATSHWDGSNHRVSLYHFGPDTELALVTVTHPTGTARRLEVDFDPTTLNAKLYYYDPAGARVQVGTAGGYTVTGLVPGGKPVGVHGAAFGAQNGSSTGQYAYNFRATYTEPAPVTTYTLTGPSQGEAGVASSEFTVTLGAGFLSSPVTITPAEAVPAGGTFSVPNVVLSEGTRSGTFRYTRPSAGLSQITATNSGALGNPAPVSFTALGAPTEVRVASVGPLTTGLLTVGYTLYSLDSTTFRSRVTAGVSEVPAGSGTYVASITVPVAFSGVIAWSETAAGTAFSSLFGPALPTPAESAGRPTDIRGMIRRLYEWAENKKVRDRATGELILRGQDGVTALVSATQSTALAVDTQTAAG